MMQTDSHAPTAGRQHFTNVVGLGLPIICPDLPYAHALCGDGPTGFDPYDPKSLRPAVDALKVDLDAGWHPDYTERIKRIPRNLEEVADRIRIVATG